MGRERVAVVLLLLLSAHTLAHGKFTRKRGRSASQTSRGSRAGKKYGDRLPWEGRQETYDWDFRQVRFICQYSASLSVSER